MKLFSRIRQRPKSYRNKVAFSASLALTSFIFVMWLATLEGRLAARGADLAADNSGMVAATSFAGDISDELETIQGTLELLSGSAGGGSVQVQTPAEESGFEESSQTLLDSSYGEEGL
ncbi:MAG TPA: hypothetical protein VJG29_00470 [Candidatus Paceibacterota bacterium]